jgi:hypothetical protein
LQPVKVAETYCSMMKVNEPPGKAEREARLRLENESSKGINPPPKVEADSPEPELPNEEAWEKERQTALAQIQNALKFCLRG